MKNYLITSGSYSEYRVNGLLAGPDDLAVPQLWEAFQRIWDHGLAESHAEYRSHVRPGFHEVDDKDGRWWSAHMARFAAITSWRSAQPWVRGEHAALPPHAFMLHGPEENFIGWLVLEHGCQEVAYEEAHLEDD